MSKSDLARPAGDDIWTPLSVVAIIALGRCIAQKCGSGCTARCDERGISHRRRSATRAFISCQSARTRGCREMTS